MTTEANKAVVRRLYEEAKVVTRYTAEGTRQGEFMGAAATGRRVRLAGSTASGSRTGGIAEPFSVATMLDVAEQLGLLGGDR